MSLKPIVLYSHATGPNPWKVTAILEELKLPYETKFLQFPEMKQDPFEKLNPNGRVPAIEDLNTGISLWESGAIVEYLVETYDKQNTISFAAGSPEYFQAKQWLHYQMSGQGPYFGQAVWFSVFHQEKIQSAIDRYLNEIRRVSGVLNKELEGKEYLVGGKYSYADAAFVPWYVAIGARLAGAVDVAKEFPNLNAWLERVKARPAVTKTFQDRAAAIAQH